MLLLPIIFLDRVEDDLADVGILRTCVRYRGERGPRRASIPGHDDSTPFAGLNGHLGCSTRSAVCLHRWLLGTACILHNLAGIRGARLVGHSKSVHPDRCHRGILYFPLTQMMLRLSGRRSSLTRENPFNSLGMQVAFVLPFSMLLLVPVGLYKLNWFFSGSDGPLGRALFAIRYSLRDAHFSVPRGNSDRCRGGDRILFFENVQPARVGHWTGSLRFRVG